MSDAPLTQADEREWILGWPPEGTEDRVAAIVMVQNGPVLTPVDEPLVVVAKQRLVEVERERDDALSECDERTARHAVQLASHQRYQASLARERDGAQRAQQQANDRARECQQVLARLLVLELPRCQAVEDAEGLVWPEASGMLSSHIKGETT